MTQPKNNGTSISFLKIKVMNSVTRFRAKKGEEIKKNSVLLKLTDTQKEEVQKFANKIGITINEFILQLAKIYKDNEDCPIFQKHFSNLLKKVKA